MALYAASCELSSVNSSAGAAAEVTTAGRYEGTYGIRAATKPGAAATDYITSEAGLGAFTTFWHRSYVYFASNGQTSGRTIFQYHNNAGTALFRLQFTSSNAIQAQYWNGSAWTNTGTAWSYPSSGLFLFDLKIICGASGSFEFFVNETSQSSGSASMTSVTDIDEIRGYSTHSSSGNEALFSEWIWGDETTIGHRYAYKPPTGNGAYTAGSGAYTDVDEAVTSDADLSTLTNNGDAETYTHAAMTLPPGTVKGVQIEARMRNAAGAAQNAQLRLRLSSTDYDSASVSGITTSWRAFRSAWATNPAGGSWDQTTAAQTSNEFGVEANT